MISLYEIAGMSGGASGHKECDTHKFSAGSAPTLSSMILTSVAAKPKDSQSGSRPAALRSGIHSGASRSEVGHSSIDTQPPSANLAPLPVSAGALPAMNQPPSTRPTPEAHHSAPLGGGSARSRAVPNGTSPIPPFPLRRGSSASMPEIPILRTPTSIDPAQAGLTESANEPPTPSASARSPSPHSA